MPGTTSRRTEVRDKASNMGPLAENSILITLIGSVICLRPWCLRPWFGQL